MTSEYRKMRDDIAQAACHACDIDTPMLASDTPRAERVYLFATPDDESRGPNADDLARDIAQTGIPVGVDRDPDSATRGVRFTAAFAPLPEGLRRYAVPAARQSWQAWRDRQDGLSADVARAAQFGIDAAAQMRRRTERQDDER